MCFEEKSQYPGSCTYGDKEGYSILFSALPQPLDTTDLSKDAPAPAQAAGGSPGRGRSNWARCSRRITSGGRQGQHQRASRTSPSPISTPRPPGSCSREPRKPRSARAPHSTEAPGPARPAAPPRGHGGTPGLPTLCLGASPPPAAPRRLPAPTGAQRFCAPRPRVPAGGMANRAQVPPREQEAGSQSPRLGARGPGLRLGGTRARLEVESSSLEVFSPRTCSRGADPSLPK